MKLLNAIDDCRRTIDLRLPLFFRKNGWCCCNLPYIHLSSFYFHYIFFCVVWSHNQHLNCTPIEKANEKKNAKSLNALQTEWIVYDGSHYVFVHWSLYSGRLLFFGILCLKEKLPFSTFRHFYFFWFAFCSKNVILW